MSARLKIAFPYLLFGAMALLVVGSNLGAGSARPGRDTSAATSMADLPYCPVCRMAVAEDTPFTAGAPEGKIRFCSADCRERFLRAVTPASQAPGSGRLVDPVCKMEVNAAWGFTHEHQGRTYHFCTERCRAEFAADPEAYLGNHCPVCGAGTDEVWGVRATYLGRTYYLCSEEHRTRFKEDPARYFMHTMWGIPPWLYYASIALVLVVSFRAFEGVGALGSRRPTSTANHKFAWDFVPARHSGAGRNPGPGVLDPGFRRGDGKARRFMHGGTSDRLDLLRFAVVRRAVRSRPFRFACQAVLVAAFALILVAGLFGNQNPALNVAPLLTWTIWWCGLVVVLMFAGKAWCYVCPWDAVATWMERLRLWRKAEGGLGLGLSWPRGMRNIWLATALFAGLTWIELGFGVTTKPFATASLGLGMLVLAIVGAFLFEGKSFCRYGCLVGRVSGLYALFSGVEVRARSGEVCRTCRGKECVRGSENAYGCPTFENPSRLSVNTYCIQCTECLQACPHDNLAVNLRPWGSDLAVEGRPAGDEAYLALLMLAITGFHGLTMTPAWPALIGWLGTSAALGPMGAFSAGMVGLMGLPLAVYAGLTWISHRIAVGSSGISYRDYFIRYAYCVLPIALFYHLAHNLEHMLMEGPKILRLLSDPLGRGSNLLGTAAWSVPPLVSLDTLWVLQVILVGVGHVYSLWAAQKISRRTFDDPVAARRGQIPILAGMIAFSIFSLWLLKQPMEMRTSAM